MSAAPDEVAYQARRVRRLGLPSGRDVRIVHELDGILGPVTPQALLNAGSALWAEWARHPQYTAPELLLGQARREPRGPVPTAACRRATGIQHWAAMRGSRAPWPSHFASRAVLGSAPIQHGVRKR
ncbi:MAG TPA: hypothetical protein VHZ03_11800 [Trebonia sp.]|nr:hypothetical protein [Trebonia sp.]